MKTVIIGAGPAGLVTCKTLLESSSEQFPFDPLILEQEDDIGGTFRYRSYENANLVSSKQLTCFSDFRLPLEHPDHLTLEEYVDYLRSYIKHFKLDSHIKLCRKVIKVSRAAQGGHYVTYIRKYSYGQDWNPEPITIHAKYLVLCTGLHVIPSIPDIPGIEYVLNPKENVDNINTAFKPAVFHSADYKRRDQLAGRRIMILGTGETGMDLAYEAAKAGAKEVTLCTRGGFLSFPKALVLNSLTDSDKCLVLIRNIPLQNDFSIFGVKFTSDRPVPIDSLITNLGETAYVHRWVEQSHLRWFVSDFVIKGVLWFLTGTMAGCNQWVGELSKDRLGRAYVFLNKSHKAMPYINRPYRKRSRFMDVISHYSDPPEDCPPHTNFTVDLAPFPVEFLPSGQAVFPNLNRKDAIRMKGRVVRPDTVIYATGYAQNFDFLDKGDDYPTPSAAEIRNICRGGDEDIAFIGFVRPGVGAIPPIAEMQVMFWISLLKGTVRNPLPPPHYYLLVKETARIKYGVDHSTYMSTLAKDIGAAPGLWSLLSEQGLHVLLCYIFGAAFTTFYRLTGPFKSHSAPYIVKTELWDTILRRGILGNIIMGLIPMMFYLTINVMAYILEKSLATLPFGLTE